MFIKITQDIFGKDGMTKYQRRTICEVPDEEGHRLVSSGKAVIASRHHQRILTSEDEKTIKTGEVYWSGVHSHENTKWEVQPHHGRYFDEDKTNILTRALGIRPRSGKSIRIPNLSPSEVSSLKSKETSEAFRELFSQDEYGNIPVKEIVNLLLVAYDRAIDMNDNDTIIRISKDLTMVLRLTKLIKGEYE